MDLKDLVSIYSKIRNRTEEICLPLQPEDYVVQAIYYTSPPKWHLAHTSWFFEELILKSNVKGFKEYDPDFSFLFNSYYNTIGERTLRAERGTITRPGVEKVLEYRKFVDKQMLQFLTTQNISNEALELIELGLNHEQQHQELLITDLKFTLGHNPIFPVYDKDKNLLTDKNQVNGTIKIKEGLYEIGYDGEDFCFDNELKSHKVYIDSFEISQSLVTNKEYLEFMEDDGYKNFRLWLDEGWTWLNEENIDSPLYWHKIKDEWHHYSLAGLKKVDPETILCHISYFEASAFANWKGMRLPTEYEWEIASDQLNWGQRWEWTNSAYLPYPGYQISEGAVGEYNGKFMVNQMVLRGASVATSAGHSRKTYRNFFHPQFQWQYSGMRLIRL